jgi:hypothetical protein
MDLIDIVVTILECIAVGFGMEVGAVVAKVVSVRLLNSASPVTVHDVEDDEGEEEETAKKRRQRRARGSGGPSTSAGVRAIM